MKNERPVSLPTIGYIDEVGIHILLLHGLIMATSQLGRPDLHEQTQQTAAGEGGIASLHQIQFN